MRVCPPTARTLTTVHTLTLGLLVFTLAHAAQADVPADSCQKPDWDMSRELKVFGGDAQSVSAGSGPSNTPVLSVGTLYQLKLHPLSEVQFLQPPGQVAKTATAFGGLTHFTVLTGGVYRITVDSPLWIDIATPTGMVAPSAFTGWHQCSVFRKSIDFTLQAGQSIALQFSGAVANLVKVTVEPPGP